MSWCIKAMGLQLSGAKLLKMPEALWVCNGIGPEWFPAWLRYLINLICPSLVLVAHIHDMRYHIGGTEDDRRAADAEFMSREMLNALEDTTPEDSEDIENRHYARESNGQFAETGAGQHSHKGGRSSKGTPKRQATKSNIPQKAAVAVKLDVLNILVDKATPTSTRQILEKKGANSMKYENGNKVGKPKLGAVAPGMETEFYVTGGSVDELLAGKHVKRSADKKSHYMAAAYVNELWERSEPLDKYRDRKKPYKESDIEWMHKRTARMRLGKDLYSVEITAKEMKNPDTTPNRLYQVKTRRIEE